MRVKAPIHLASRHFTSKYSIYLTAHSAPQVILFPKLHLQAFLMITVICAFVHDYYIYRYLLCHLQLMLVLQLFIFPFRDHFMQPVIQLTLANGTVLLELSILTMLHIDLFPDHLCQFENSHFNIFHNGG